MTSLLFLALLHWLCPASRAASKGPRKALQILSEEPLIELHRGFVKEEEIQAIRKLAEEEMFQDLSDPEAGSSSSPDVTGGEEVSVLNISDPDIETEDAPEWDVVKDLVIRAGTHASRAGAHASLSSFGAYVVRWAPWRPGSALNRSGPLHLDARLHPERRRSVVLPLTGKGREEDGGTVFPCVETEDMDVQELRRREKLCSRAMRHLQLAHDKLMAVRDEGLALAPSEQYAFLEKHPELAGLPKETAEGLRPVNWLWLPGHDAVALEALGCAAAGKPLHALAEAMCHGKAPGLRVLSRRGDALVMDVMETETPREVKPDWRLWHAGCSPEEPEEERLTAQIFLYSPSNSTCNVESCRKAVIH